MDKVFRYAAAALALGAVSGEVAHAQTGRYGVQSEWDIERARAAQEHRIRTQEAYDEMVTDLGEVRGLEDVSRGLTSYLQVSTNLARCEYNPSIRMQRLPTVPEMTGTDALTRPYNTAARILVPSDILSDLEYSRREAREIIAGACLDVREAGRRLADELTDINLDEARSGE